MDIENVRFLLSAMIQSLAAVMVIGFIVLLNFPRRQSGSILNTKLYDLYLEYVKRLGLVFIAVIFAHVLALAFLDSVGAISSFIISSVTSFIAFILLLAFLTHYIKEIKNL